MKQNFLTKFGTALILTAMLLCPSAMMYANQSKTGSSQAQQEPQKKTATKMEIVGTVKDVMGDPLIGAGVFVKGTAIGTTTDAMGRYTIMADSDAILVFSFIGFKDGEKPVNNRSVVDITLVEDQNLLDDVVVVGYGTQSRKTLSTSISKVDGDKLYGQPVSSVGDALKGKVSGLRVATNSALAGDSPRFLIRGGSSINMGNDPIYIVDGALRDDLSGINPNDIESMEVLKDAASAAIYGARASNGVILVTTKKGNVSRGPEIVFDAQVGFAAPEKKWDLSLESGAALRTAIDEEDIDNIVEALKNCYKEINRKMPEAMDDDELENQLDDIDMAFSDPEDVDEELVDMYLADFYDLCDGYNI